MPTQSNPTDRRLRLSRNAARFAFGASLCMTGFIEVARLADMPELGILGVEGPGGKGLCLVRFEGRDEARVLVVELEQAVAPGRELEEI